MNKIKFSLICLLLTSVGLTACNKGDDSGSNDAATNTSASSSSSDDGKTITFVSTQDGSPLEIKHELFDTPEAKEFLKTGKNPYIGNQEAIAQGKKLFQLYSCTQCHGANAQGQVGPGLSGPNYRYAKDATNKGMFETIWHGTNGGMGAKGKGLMDPSDPSNGLSPDEVLKIIAWVRTHGSTTGNEES